MEPSRIKATKSLNLQTMNVPVAADKFLLALRSNKPIF
jgi:hypothetical protein